jgi:hypothetical protein
MFPQANDMPPHRPEPAVVPQVSSAIVINLYLPLFGKFVPPSRKTPSVPEISVHEDHHFGGAKDEIGLAGQVAAVALK